MGETMDELLTLLRKNALESPCNLARMLGLPEAVVKARIDEYEREGVIRGYQAVINEDKLELDRVRSVIEVRMTPDRSGGYDRIAERIGKFPEVESLYLMSGGYDLLVFVTGRNLREVAAFVNERLATIQGVLSTATHFALKTYKDQGVLMRAEREHERLSISP
jgi:DNA-binding Lrp family transcriptional regulator